MALSEGLVYGGQQGTGAATVIKTQGINPAEMYLQSIQEDKANKAAETESRKKSNAAFAKGMSDFDATGWYRDETEIAKSVQGVRDYAMEARKQDVNVFDPNNAEAYMEVQKRMANTKRLADNSTQHQDIHKSNQTFLRNNQGNIDPASQDEYTTWLNLPINERSQSEPPSLRLIPEKTDWMREFNKEYNPTTVGVKKEEDGFKINSVSANRGANRKIAESHVKNHVNKDQMLSELNMTEEEAVDMYAENLNSQANTKYEKLSSDGGDEYYHGSGNADDTNPYGLSTEVVNMGIDDSVGADQTFYIDPRAMKNQTGITVHPSMVVYPEEGRMEAEYTGDFKFIPEAVLRIPTHQGEIISEPRMKDFSGKVDYKKYVRGTSVIYETTEVDILDPLTKMPTGETKEVQKPFRKTVMIPLDESTKGAMNASLKGFKKYNDKLENDSRYKPSFEYNPSQNTTGRKSYKDI